MSTEFEQKKDWMNEGHHPVECDGIDLCRIARELSFASGENFFHSLAESLARLLDVETVVIGELPVMSEVKEIRTLAVFSQDHLVETFTYLLAPCEQLACQKVCVVPDGARDVFPEDHLLMEMGVRGYVGMPLKGSSGQALGMIAVLSRQPLEHAEFVTALIQLFATRAASELERRQQESRFRNLCQSVEQSPSVVLITDATGRIEYVNPSFTRITGYQPESVLGKTPDLLKSGAVNPSVYQHLWQTITEGETWRGELENRKQNGECYWEAATISPVLDEHGNTTHFLKVAEDITLQKQTEKKLQEVTHYDRLTGLANHYSFNGHLYHAIDSARLGDRFAVVFLNIDDFSKFNNTFGHMAGNSILMETGARLSDCLRPGDLIARQSADTFIVLLSALGEADDVSAVAQRLHGAFTQPFPLLSEGGFALSCGMGISIFPDDGTDAGLLLQMADTALSEAKQHGRGSIRCYSTAMNVGKLRLLNLENDLRKAVRNEELEVYYQPQVDAVSGRLVGLEALARWHHPELGPISPAEFIPLAEGIGLISDLGSRVLLRACQHARHLLSDGLDFMRVAVNISAHQLFQKNLVAEVADVLKETGLNAEMLELEITESALMLDPDEAQHILQKIRELGVGIALDDFGTGYSSLSYLRRFPITRLKVDRSFVLEIESSPDDAAIVRTIINMAGNLNLAVLAEGVESRFQRESLAEWGCHEFQGFFFAKPMPPEEVVVWARAHAQSRPPCRVLAI